MTKRQFLSLLVVLYSFAIIHLHDFFVQLSVVAMNHFSLATYNSLVQNIIVVFGVFLVSVTTRKAFKNKRFRLFSFFLFYCLLLFIHWLFLFEMNIEIIHAFEFGVLALLLYLITENVASALILCLPIMIFDEINQYVFLYGNYNKYFEFNDIVLDILGSSIFLFLFKIFEKEPKYVTLPLSKRKEFWLLGLFYFSFLVLTVSCVFAVHENAKCSNTIFVLSRIDFPEKFWQHHAFTKAVYHILSPYVGAFIIFLLCFFSGFSDYVPERKNR